MPPFRLTQCFTSILDLLVYSAIIACFGMQRNHPSEKESPKKQSVLRTADPLPLWIANDIKVFGHQFTTQIRPDWPAGDIHAVKGSHRLFAVKILIPDRAAF